MINNPNLIEEIKKQLRNTTREQLDQAMKLVDEEYDLKIEFEYEQVYSISNDYSVFSVHKKKPSNILSILFGNKKDEEVGVA